jgi:hypothetical protein
MTTNTSTCSNLNIFLFDLEEPIHTGKYVVAALVN